MSPIRFDTTDVPRPHLHVRVLVDGEFFSERGGPRGAVILLHGRGASAEDIVSIVPSLDQRDLLFIAPNANGSTWYPQSFLAPLALNQPHVESAHALIETIIRQLGTAGVTPERIALLGFSQGACLASDHAYRHPRRYGAIIALTGGLIGPPGERFDPVDEGRLAGTPVFLGANDPDPHVPWTRVEETAAVLQRLGGQIELRRYPNRPHAVLMEEIEAVRPLLAAMRASNTSAPGMGGASD